MTSAKIIQRPTAGPQALAARMRDLAAAAARKPGLSEATAAAAEFAETQQQLCVAFAEAHDWTVATVPMAVQELARRSSGGKWHRPSREWLQPFAASPSFFRDAERRCAAVVGHPMAGAIEGERERAEVWAAERGLRLTFPDFPSWESPDAVLALFEPAETAGRRVAESLPAALGQAPSSTNPVDNPHPDPAPGTAPDHHEMRPVAPIDLGDILPADLIGEAGPDFDLVAPTELLVDEAYQRDLSPKSLALIRRIVRTWSWAKFKPPVCARVDGRLHIIDGQHTAIAAASHGGIAIIPVVVVAVPEITDRAAAFVSHATDRVQATPTQIFRAAVAAGDEDAMTIARVCDAADVDLVAYPPPRSEYRPRQTIALHAIRRLVDKRGAMRARQVLEALANADLAPITADHIRIGEALICDPAYAGDFDPERLTAALRQLGERGAAEARELAIAKRLPLWRAIVAVIYRNRRPRQRAGNAAGVERANA